MSNINLSPNGSFGWKAKQKGFEGWTKRGLQGDEDLSIQIKMNFSSLESLKLVLAYQFEDFVFLHKIIAITQFCCLKLPTWNEICVIRMAEVTSNAECMPGINFAIDECNAFDEYILFTINYVGPTHSSIQKIYIETENSE